WVTAKGFRLYLHPPFQDFSCRNGCRDQAVQAIARATPAMSEDNLLPFAFPPVQRKKVVAAFDGGRLTSDGGVMLLAAAERRLGIVDKLAALISDPRDPNLVKHSVADILRATVLRPV